VGRTYFTRPARGQGAFGGDRLRGIDGYLTAAAGRTACLAGLKQSFAQAQRPLAELAGRDLDDETARRPCQATAARAAAGRDERATAQAFAAAAGDPEVQTDAGKANTLDGRRDVKVAVSAGRPRGAPAGAADGGRRDLPAPTARPVVAAAEEAAAFGGRCGAEARRLGLTEPGLLNVLGDGADWIRRLSRQQFPGAAEALDIYHGAEHLAEGARRARGEGTDRARAQAERGRARLLEDGYAGVTEWVGQLGGQIAEGGDGGPRAGC